MKVLYILATAVIAGTPVLANETRQLDAHEHGVGQLNMAFEGQQIAMTLHAPGADIVGFEYAASSAEDRAAVDAAVAALARPLELLVLPAAAECSVVQASAKLESEEDHDAHSDHDHDAHDHEDHADDGHKEHDHEDHADHEDHKDHAHANEAQHTEFHAEYLLTCANPTAISQINFAYFASFPNALELEVQVVSETGALSFEATRDAPVLDLRDMF